MHCIPSSNIKDTYRGSHSSAAIDHAPTQRAKRMVSIETTKHTTMTPYSSPGTVLDYTLGLSPSRTEITKCSAFYDLCYMYTRTHSHSTEYHREANVPLGTVNITYRHHNCIIPAHYKYKLDVTASQECVCVCACVRVCYCHSMLRKPPWLIRQM